MRNRRIKVKVIWSHDQIPLPFKNSWLYCPKFIRVKRPQWNIYGCCMGPHHSNMWGTRILLQLWLHYRLVTCSLHWTDVLVIKHSTFLLLESFIKFYLPIKFSGLWRCRCWLPEVEQEALVMLRGINLLKYTGQYCSANAIEIRRLWI
jgi:hypothetical protein